MTRISRSLDITLAVLVLALAVALPALAGGEKCAHDAEAKAGHATKAEKMAKMKQAGWSGIEAEADGTAYVITAVHPNSPAARAGVHEGDRLVAYQGIEIKKENHDKLKKAKKSRGVGSEVTYTIERGGSTRQVALVLTEVPDAVLAAWAAEAEETETVASID